MRQIRKDLKISLRLPFSTILTIVVSMVAFRSLEILAPLILLPLLIGMILAVALSPVLRWLERHRVPQWLAVCAITFMLTGFLVAIAGAIIPKLLTEFSNFIDNLPQMRTDLLNHLSKENPFRNLVDQNLTKQALLPARFDLSHFYDVGTRAFGGLTEVVLILVFTIYLLIDGPRMIQWSTAFLSNSKRLKVRQTFREMAKIIFAYAAGQFITSILSFVFCFAVLSFLQVPGALLLAALAGIFDVLPILGFFLAVFPAMLFAVQVSNETPIYVLLLYIAYHILENYVIVPLVYGNRLRLSGFTVLISTLAAGVLAGIEGAITILPLVASYPVIEKLWLQQYIGSDVVEKHETMSEDDNKKDRKDDDGKNDKSTPS